MLDVQIERLAVTTMEAHGCHTVILYGSRARGDATLQSDVDLLCVREAGPAVRDARIVDGLYLDAFIYPEATLRKLEPSLLRVLGGIVVCERGGFGSALLAQGSKNSMIAVPRCYPMTNEKLFSSGRKRCSTASAGSMGLKQTIGGCSCWFERSKTTFCCAMPGFAERRRPWRGSSSTTSRRTSCSSAPLLQLQATLASLISFGPCTNRIKLSWRDAAQKLLKQTAAVS